MKNNAIISIIVPIYNVEKYLSKCLDSLINQTYKDIEIICVNNGSTDNSLSLLKQYQAKENRIKIIEMCNEGVSIARNKGLDNANGDYIMFVDSDDWIDLETCEEVMKTVTKNEADVVMWSYIREFENKSIPKKIFNEDEVIFTGDNVRKIHRRFIGLLANELAMVESADALCTVWGKIYKSSIIKQNKIDFIDIRKIGSYEDGLFNLNVFKYVNKAVYIDKYYYHYRKNNIVSITSNYNDKLYDCWQNLYNLMEKYIKDNFLSDEYRTALNNRISIGIIGLGLNEMSSNDNFINKLKRLRDIIKNKRYKDSIKHLELKYFPIHWKVFFLCAKYNITAGLYILILCIKKGISR